MKLYSIVIYSNNLTRKPVDSSTGMHVKYYYSLTYSNAAAIG